MEVEVGPLGGQSGGTPALRRRPPLGSGAEVHVMQIVRSDEHLNGADGLELGCQRVVDGVGGVQQQTAGWQQHHSGSAAEVNSTGHEQVVFESP